MGNIQLNPRIHILHYTTTKMSSQPKVLFVLTSHDQMGNTGKPTGWYLPEFATSTTSHKLINEFASQNKIVSAVCHGPAALAYVKTSSGSYLLDGHAVTGFSTSEEDAVGLTSAMPFILEDQLNVAS